MNHKKSIFALFFVFFLALGIVAMTPVEAAPTDSFNVRAGDWWVLTITESKTPGFVGNMTKYQVDVVNNSYIRIGPSTWIWCDTVWGDMWIANSTNTTWIQWANNTFFGRYNITEPNLAMVGGFLGQGIACTNLTVFNISIFTQNSGLGINCSCRNGLTLTYWNGLTGGNGTSSSSQKFVMTLDPTKYVISSSDIYLWNTITSQWDKTGSYIMTSNSWTTTTPPIPGFEFAFITMALMGIMSLYLFRRKKQLEI